MRKTFIRKNLRGVLESFRAGNIHNTPSCWTDGVSVFSYHTCILTKGSGGVVILNRTNYSRTTTIQQNSLAVEFPNAMIVVDVPPGGDRESVLLAALTPPA